MTTQQLQPTNTDFGLSISTLLYSVNLRWCIPLLFLKIATRLFKYQSCCSLSALWNHAKVPADSNRFPYQSAKHYTKATTQHRGPWPNTKHTRLGANQKAKWQHTVGYLQLPLPVLFFAFDHQKAGLGIDFPCLATPQVPKAHRLCIPNHVRIDLAPWQQHGIKPILWWETPGDQSLRMHLHYRACETTTENIMTAVFSLCSHSYTVILTTRWNQGAHLLHEIFRLPTKNATIANIYIGCTFDAQTTREALFLRQVQKYKLRQIQNMVAPRQQKLEQYHLSREDRRWIQVICSIHPLPWETCAQGIWLQLGWLFASHPFFQRLPRKSMWGAPLPSQVAIVNYRGNNLREQICTQNCTCSVLKL